MVEIYSTNIINEIQADVVLKQLQEAFPHYKINFDLEDCDNILRVESPSEVIKNETIIVMVNELSFMAIPFSETAMSSEKLLKFTL